MAAALGVNRTVANVLRLSARRERERGMPEPPLFRPHTTGWRYGFAHYNVVFPDLPAPHLFLACAVMIGQTGTRAFDDDSVVVGEPRDTATVASGTAATAPCWFRAYSVQRECELSEDGTVLRFGREVALTGAFPELTLSITQADFHAELRLQVTDNITWFASSLIYEHVGLPARYEGWVSWGGVRVQVSGVCSFEHARSTPVNVLANRRVPALLKLPVSFFTYQVLALDEDHLLLLTHVRALGTALMTTARLLSVGDDRPRCLRSVRFARGPGGGTEVAPDGASTRIPTRFTWKADPGGPELSIETVPDTEMIYGIGRGWIGGVQFSGHYDGAAVRGRGYLEYIDRPYRTAPGRT